MSSVLEIAKTINKAFKNDKLAVMADVAPNYKRLACGDLGMDFPLYGGLPLGRLCVYAGKEHSGKTTASCLEMAAYQRQYPDRMCIFVDVEHSLDKEFQSAMTGLDLTKLLYFNPENMSGEQILDAVLELQEADNIGMIIIDSIPALVSSRDYDTEVDKDVGRAGGIAKPLAKFIKKIIDQLVKKQNILILINQVRAVGTTFTGATIYDEPGGHAPKFYSSVKVRFGNRTFTQGDKMDCADGENADGFRLKFAITKNKTAPTQRGGGFLTFRYATGVDWSYDLFEIATKYEFIKRPTSRSYVLVNLETGETYKDESGNDLKFVGKQAVKDYLTEHIEFQNEYLAMLQNHISNQENKYGNLLDSRELAKIQAEEDSVNGERDDDGAESEA